MEDSIILIQQLQAHLRTSEYVINELCFVIKKEQMECALYCVHGQDILSLPTGSGKLSHCVMVCCRWCVIL